jgi:hypothetical protein
MFRSALSKVMWVGRATVFLVGLAVIGALVLGVASTALGADGKPLILGKISNRATTVTRLIGEVATGSALVVKNPSGGSALTLSVGVPAADPATKTAAPMKVNSQQVVTNLNADELDGKSEADFYAAGSKVADSSHADQADSATSAGDANTLDNKDSTEFLAADGKAADSELLDGKNSAAFAAAYKRTVVVSPVGTDTQNGQALLAAMEGITDASAAKPYLLYIEPATYDLGTQALQMKPWVDIEGSGELNTIITRGVSGFGCSTGTVVGANNAELRFLTVRKTGTATSCNVAIYTSSTSPRLTHVTAEATGGSSNYGVYNVSSSPTMTAVTATGSGGTFNYGVFNDGGSSPTIRQSKLSGSSNSLWHGIGGTAKVALTQLEGPVSRTGGTLQCFNNFDQNLAAVSCP